MSDFTTKIYSKSDYGLFVKNDKDRDINKVLLFTKKEKITPVFKALSAQYRDRLRFTVVPLPDKKESADNLELKKEYNVTELPTLILEQTYSVRDKMILEEPVRIPYTS